MFLLNDICINSDVSKLMIAIGLFINIIKILIPLILIILGVKDFFYATVNPNNDAIKKASILLRNRIIAGIIIFFIPTLVSFAITLVTDKAEIEDTFSSCTTCMLNVSDCSSELSALIEAENKKEEEKKEENNKKEDEKPEKEDKEEEKEEEQEEPETTPEEDEEQEENSGDFGIKNISKDGVIVTIKANKGENDIAGYYFSYTNERPNKETGGYVSTSDSTLEVVRLAGTTYVWVEDKNGNISEAKKIIVNSSDIVTTTGKEYKILKGTTLESYLEDQGSSIAELDKIMARSVRAAGLYSKEAVATSAISFTQVLAKKYKVKIPYQSAGIYKVPGANPKWGGSRSNPKADNEKYYGLDCSAFVNWTYANAGFGINSRVYYWGDSVPRVAYSEANGDIGDVLVYGRGNQKGRHVRLIIGKTDTEFIIAEASGSGVAVTTQKFTKDGGYEIQKADYLTDVNRNKDYYLNSNYPTGN